MLNIYEVELVIEIGEDFFDGGKVGDNSDFKHDHCEFTAMYESWRLVFDVALQIGMKPVDELDGSFGIDVGNGVADVLGDDVVSVHHAASHLLAVERVAFGHHWGGFDQGNDDLGEGELFAEFLLGGYNGCVGAQHVVIVRVWNQVVLELGDIEFQGDVRSQRSGQKENNLRKELYFN